MLSAVNTVVSLRSESMRSAPVMARTIGSVVASTPEKKALDSARTA